MCQIEPFQADLVFLDTPNVYHKPHIKSNTCTRTRSEPISRSKPVSKYELAKTPIQLDQLKKDLACYPNRVVAEELANGFQFGFPLHYTGSRLPHESKNLKTVDQHPDVVRQKIQQEIDLGRVGGPFSERPIPTLRVSPLGLVEKKTPGDFRLIHHLSFPEGNSLNDYIDPDLCSVQYTSFDEAVHMVQDAGEGCLMAKLDIKSAFRLLPVSPSDFDQLGFKFESKYYFDKSMPFGCSISPATWEKVSCFLEFLVKQESKGGDVKHYVDDFLFAGKRGTIECFEIMTCFSQCADRLGIPIASEKTVWPCTNLVYLGLELDSIDMVVRMPKSKIEEIVLQIQVVLSSKKVTLKVMQRLIGLLNFATRVIIPGRPFLRRLINTTRGLSKPYQHLRVTSEVKQDLQMWLNFFSDFNGVSVFHDRFWVSNEDYQLYTDSAAGHGLGFGAVFNSKWMYGVWPADWHERGLSEDITVLELFPVLASLVVWGPALRNKKILFHCDNQAVVHILNTMTSKSDKVMVLVRALTLECLHHNMIIKGQYIVGKTNILTDSLSRLQVEKFLKLAPNAEEHPEVVPSHLWRIFD